MCDYQQSAEYLVERDGYQLLRTRVPGEGVNFYEIEFKFSDEYLGHSLAERLVALNAQLHVLENEVAKIPLNIFPTAHK